MKIMFCGATTGVTGSCHLLKTENHNVLLDCGQFQGGKAQEALNADPFPFEPSEVECMILSHAHIDHCGRIPLLVKRGFRGKIYCTDATADLLEVMLLDSAHIHEMDAQWQSKRNLRAGKPPIDPLYTTEDAQEALKYVEPILYDQQIRLNDDMKIVFNDAGHILGSAITEIWVTEGERESKIVFSGDLGMKNRPILRDPVTIKKADCVIMETTYGNRNHAQNSMSVKQLIDIILKTTRRGGTVVIPSFAVGRTQELIYELNRFYEKSSPDYRQELDKVDVIVDSPMATTATEVFRNNAQVFDEETKAYIMKGDNPLDFKNLRFTRSTEESRALNTDHTPKVIISASGMCEAGRIRHHLKHNLWDARNSVIFVGYQGEGTLGRSLIEGKKDITLFGEEVHVNAEIYNLEGFSGHADQNGLLEWISGFQQPPRQIFLVHGEEQSKKDFAKLIHDKLGYDPIPVLGNSEFELDMNDVRVLNMTEAVQTAAEDEDVQKVRSKISEIETELEGILYNTSLAMSQSMSEEKLVRINNVVQELEKATINLGTAVNQREEPPRP
ncbi:MBL fold metallo-hydrolase RNA specificity domain-containing protein [Hornefia butyriciproducens]|jgi:metallo-beta-lactamase family protein|uniref:MBL fold metallo-hydrolase n=1 Tax=Hornefia butyriciproducens TaxID=2652293 RepID=A0A6L5Y268_9FIRM|nr:MBL fold metallo-hydrolase [Hornefia butyriciproducens]MDD6299593.1 MBL fold metallo-hydrolase [Hornefia butyriciproducens]MST50746.1 MBL fold metallo-hydrolase [Hornefia butyriciproducens]